MHHAIIIWYPTAYGLWSMIYALLGINWVISGTVRGELWAREGLCVKRKVAKLIPLTIFWVFLKRKGMVKLLMVEN